MRWLKKINKGFALTIIVLIVLIIYLVSVEISRNAEKTNIEEACKEYIQLMNKYAVMPETSQKVYNITELNEGEQLKLQDKLQDEANKAITSQMNKLETELKTKMIDNELAVNMQKDRLQEYVKNSNNIFNTVRTKFNKEIKKIKKFAFDDEQVTLTFISKVEEELKQLNSDSKEVSKIQNFDTSEETITLQNVDGKWKVVYADLQYYNYSAGYYPGTSTSISI